MMRTRDIQKNMILQTEKDIFMLSFPQNFVNAATWAVFEPGAVRIVHIALHSCHYMGNPFLSLMSLVRLL